MKKFLLLYLLSTIPMISGEKFDIFWGGSLVAGSLFFTGKVYMHNTRALKAQKQEYSRLNYVVLSVLGVCGGYLLYKGMEEYQSKKLIV